jgi:hypothetical protein
MRAADITSLEAASAVKAALDRLVCLPQYSVEHTADVLARSAAGARLYPP